MPQHTLRWAPYDARCTEDADTAADARAALMAVEDADTAADARAALMAVEDAVPWCAQ